MILKHLEISDRVQGFQLSVDVNSGFSSLAKEIIEKIIKDEAPKAPVYLFSMNNKVNYDTSGLSPEELTNMETKKELIGLNQSLFFSEL